MKKLPVKEQATLEASSQRLYLMDPVLFSIYCMLPQRENRTMRCITRYYKGFIEYNPYAFEYIDNWLLFEDLASTLCRIALNHTTERKPEGVTNLSLSIASDMTMHGFYNFLRKKLHDMGQYPEGQDLVWYAYRVQNDTNMHQKAKDLGDCTDSLQNPDRSNGENPFDLPPEMGSGRSFPYSDKEESEKKPHTTGRGVPNPNPDSQEEEQDNKGKGGGKNKKQDAEKEKEQNKSGGGQDEDNQHGLSDQTLQGQADPAAMRDFCDGWEDDPYLKEQVKQVIQEAVMRGNSWGNITGNGVERLKASLEPKVNYRDMLSSFKTSITNADRILTRMKPNRRTGFLQMGSRRDFKSRLLIAVDVSGSVSSNSLIGFYSIINGIFRFGGADIDTIQFDYDVTSEIKPLKHADTNIEVTGRGGTNFQAVIDYVHTNRLQYDGILYFTDGIAPLPELPYGFRSKLMWLLDTKAAYNSLKDKLKERRLGRAAWMDLATEMARVNLL